MCVLFVVSFVVCGLLCAAGSELFVVYCLLCVVCCLLFVVCCVLCVVCCVLCSLCSVPRVLFAVYGCRCCGWLSRCGARCRLLFDVRCALCVACCCSVVFVVSLLVFDICCGLVVVVIC